MEDLEAQFDVIAEAFDRIDELLNFEDAARSDVLVPDAARVAVLAQSIRDRSESAAIALRGGLEQNAAAIIRTAQWVGSAILLLGLAVVWYFARTVSRPVKALTSAVTALAQGNTTVALPALAHDDELADLSRALLRLRAAEEEKIVLRRQAEQMHDLLLAEKERAEAENGAKTDFLVSMGHELHRPLTEIARYAESLMGELHRIGQGDLAGDAEMIQWSAEQLTDVLESILDYSKIESGTAELRPQDFDVGRLLAEVRERGLSGADINGNTLIAFAAPGLGAMWSDFDKVRQILINLVDNACRFTRNGQVTLAAERLERDGQEWLRFSVTDTGCGFAPSQASSLFKPFVKGAHGTGQGGRRGAGLGLTMVAHYCAMLGGDIEVASQVGRGTRIIVRLPVVCPTQEGGGRLVGTTATARPLLTVAEAPAD